MTLHDFNRAKEIEKELETITSNIKALNKALDVSYVHPNAKHIFETQTNVFAKFICDQKFLEAAIEYYENEEKKLNAEFEALGKSDVEKDDTNDWNPGKGMPPNKNDVWAKGALGR